MSSPQTPYIQKADELIHEFMSQEDIDFGYAVGNLNMDTTKESREDFIKRLKQLLATHQKALLTELKEGLIEKPEDYDKWSEHIRIGYDWGIIEADAQISNKLKKMSI